MIFTSVLTITIEVHLPGATMCLQVDDVQGAQAADRLSLLA